VFLRREDAMELRDERLSTLRELLRRAEHDSTDGSEEDFRRKPQHGVVAPLRIGAAPERPDAGSGDDWSGTLDLVLRASEKLVASEERVRDLEVEVRELTESAAQEIQQLRAQVAVLQHQLSDADAARQHAEDWLRRLTEAVRERFDLNAPQESETPAAKAS
jgi:chromosome segregation ATPase